MNKSTELLNELIEAARDGRKFYLDAASKVEDAEVYQVFSTQACAKELLINDLSQHVVAHGAIASEDETLVGKTRMLYAEILAALSADRDRIYVAQLEEVEGRLLERFRRALKETESEDVRRMLSGHITTVRAGHERMKMLKHRKRAA